MLTISIYIISRLNFIVIAIRVWNVTDALSTMLRLLGEELEEASWLMKARSRMEPVKLYDEEW
jgi:hypothetical protein